MYFADFENLKIIKDYNFKTIHIDIPLKEEQLGIKKLNDYISSIIEKIQPECNLSTCFEFNFIPAFEADEEEKTDLMLTLANYCVPMLMRHLEIGIGYKRERRLNAPEQLKTLHTTQSVIKRATNYAMYPDKINIKIILDNLTYYLCDGRKVEDSDE